MCLTNMQTSINTKRVFWYNLTFKKVCYKHSAKQPAVLGRTFEEWCEIVIVNNIAICFMNNLSFVCVFLFPVFNAVGVFSVALFKVFLVVVK